MSPLRFSPPAHCPGPKQLSLARILSTFTFPLLPGWRVAGEGGREKLASHLHILLYLSQCLRCLTNRTTACWHPLASRTTTNRFPFHRSMHTRGLLILDVNGACLITHPCMASSSPNVHAPCSHALRSSSLSSDLTITNAKGRGWGTPPSVPLDHLPTSAPFVLMYPLHQSFQCKDVTSEKKLEVGWVCLFARPRLARDIITLLSLWATV